jgi:putative ABC transport system permease protein
MKGRDLAELALRNLRESVLRNSLTTLGIGVGITSLVALGSLGVGLQNLASERLAKSGVFDAIYVAPKTRTPGFGREQNPNTNPDTPPVPLDTEAREKFAKLPNVVDVYADIRFPSEIHFDGKPYQTVVAGVAELDKSEGAFDSIKGSFFSGAAANEAILQIDFARQLAPQQTDSLIGKDLILRYAQRQALPPDPGSKDSEPAGFSVESKDQPLRIVGIVETDPAGGFGPYGRGRVFIPMQLAEKLRTTQANDLRDLLRDTPNKRNYETLTVRVRGATKLKETETAIKNMGFAAYSILDATQALQQVFAVFDIFLLIFGSLALVVASLGVINTLVMAILERRREIGILKALGAADRDVSRLFFVEAGAMGLLGGILGVILGFVISRAINLGTNFYLARRDLPAISVTSVPWWMVAAAIAFSILVSLAAGMYPASRAAKLDPVQALRYE